MTQEPTEKDFPPPPSEEPFDTALRVLNEMFKLDPSATACLIHNHIPCSGAVVNHPTILVQPNANGREALIAAYGLINGVVEAMTKRRIGIRIETATGRNVLKGFMEIPIEK